MGLFDKPGGSRNTAELRRIYEELDRLSEAEARLTYRKIKLQARLRRFLEEREREECGRSLF